MEPDKGKAAPKSGPSMRLVGTRRGEVSNDRPHFQAAAQDYASSARRTAITALNTEGSSSLALLALAGEHAKAAQSFARRAAFAQRVATPDCPNGLPHCRCASRHLAMAMMRGQK